MMDSFRTGGRLSTTTFPSNAATNSSGDPEGRPCNNCREEPSQNNAAQEDDDDDLLESLSYDDGNSASSLTKEASAIGHGETTTTQTLKQQQREQHNVTTTTSEEDTTTATTLKLLTKFLEEVDPTSKINEHYQKRGHTQSLKSCWRDYSSPDENGKLWWRCTLTDPLLSSNSSGGNAVVYHSSLPRSLLLTHPSSETKNNLTHLETVVQQLFGECRVRGDCVYFSTKKGAKKSAALTALERLDATGLDLEGERIMFHSIQDALTSSSSDINNTAERSTKDQAILENGSGQKGKGGDSSGSELQQRLPPSTNIPTKRAKARRHYPSWVKELCELGIDSTSLEVSFQEAECLTGDDGRMNSDRWNKFSVPTLLCCTLSVTKANFGLSVDGEPSPTKRAALKSAVSLLSKKTRMTQHEDKHQQQQGLDNSHCLSKQSCTNEDDEDSWLELERLLAYFDMQTKVTYRYPLPPWATEPIVGGGMPPNVVTNHNVTGVSDDKWENKQLHLYEVEFLTQSGESFVSSQMGLDEDCTTQLGIAFAEDIRCGIPAEAHEDDNKNDNATSPQGRESSVVHYQARFNLPKPHGGDANNVEVVTVKLKNHTMFDMAFEEDSLVAHRLLWMKSFNRSIHEWKVYGLGSDTEIMVDDSEVGTETAHDSPLDRTYMFVPLCNPSSRSGSTAVDWTMLQHVATNRRTPYISSPHENWCLPFVGNIDLTFIGYTAGLLALAVFAPYLYDLVRMVGTSSTPQVQLQQWEIILGFVLGGMSIVALSLVFFLPPKRVVPPSLLQNRFMVQRKPARKALYVIPPMDGISFSSSGLRVSQECAKTAQSSLLTAENIASLSPNKLEYNIRNLSLDLRTASFAQYYMKKYGIPIHYKGEELLPVHSIEKHVDHDLLSILVPDRDNESEGDNELAYIIPELVRVLPMPRDVLYMCRHADKFMPPLERAIELDSFGKAFSNMAANYIAIQHSAQPTLCMLDQTVSLSSMLDEATTLTPCVTYNRLEHLGDAVLAFFLALNVMARNSCLQWDFDDLSQIHSTAGKNKFALFHAALRIGASRFVQTGLRKWQSAYTQSERKKMHSQQQITSELPDKVLSDVVESLLGVAFIAGRNTFHDGTDGGCLVLALLEELQLPLPEPEGQQQEEQSGGTWFRIPGCNPCLTGGYPFVLDNMWNQELLSLGSILCSEHEISDRLEQGWKMFIDFLSNLVSVHHDFRPMLESQFSRILMLCALFDEIVKDRSPFGDSLFYQSENGVDKDSVDYNKNGSEEGLYRVALFRDSLFHVGNYALQLFVTDQVYKRYPEATAGDLHLLRSCAMSDDVVAYIMMKVGIHEFLCDREVKAVSQFRHEMMKADAVGRGFWTERGGWVLGLDEFRRRFRTQQVTAGGVSNDSSAVPILPQYVGLAGGRLHGHKSKLPKELTEDLAFSMKTIVGALVLSLGLDGMTCCLGPLFEEVMLLSAEELRSEYKNISGICNVYQKGHESSKAKAFR